MEPEVAKWLAARRADVAYLLGEFDAAARQARARGGGVLHALRGAAGRLQAHGRQSVGSAPHASSPSTSTADCRHPPSAARPARPLLEPPRAAARRPTRRRPSTGCRTPPSAAGSTPPGGSTREFTLDRRRRRRTDRPRGAVPRHAGRGGVRPAAAGGRGGPAARQRVPGRRPRPPAGRGAGRRCWPSGSRRSARGAWPPVPADEAHRLDGLDPPRLRRLRPRCTRSRRRCSTATSPRRKERHRRAAGGLPGPPADEVRRGRPGRGRRAPGPAARRARRAARRLPARPDAGAVEGGRAARPGPHPRAATRC